MRPSDPQRTTARVIIGGFLVLATLVLGLPNISLGQVPDPTVEFLNPSEFARREGGDALIIVSDKQPSAGTGAATLADTTYRLSAWARDVPPSAGVEFELLTTAGVPLDVIGVGQPVGSDTWEFDWDIPMTQPDGNFTLRATLFQGEVGVDTDDVDVTINRVADRAELTYPNTRPSQHQLFPAIGEYGTYAALDTALPQTGATTRKPPVGNHDVILTSGASSQSKTTHVQAFYTVSSPGTEPEWISCGDEPNTGSGAQNGVRCELAVPEHQTQVTAAAAVANVDRDTVSGEPGRSQFHEAGDATRVLAPYVQQITEIVFTDGNRARNNRDDRTGLFGCGADITGRVSDQENREIASANLDAHAWAPGDRLLFDNATVSTIRTASANKAPDRTSHADEPTFVCSTESQQQAGRQGRHNLFGRADKKHIETTGSGSSESGTWTIKLRNEQQSNGTTSFLIWVDEVDDGCAVNNDQFNIGELAAFGSQGWGVDPADPETEDPTQTPTCTPGATPTPTPTGSPSPTPTTSPSETPSGERSINLQSNKRRVRRGRPVTFSGSITADMPECETGERVNLMAKRANDGRFRRVGVAQTDATGDYRVVVRPRRTKFYRAVAPANGPCELARSNIIRVRVRRG